MVYNEREEMCWCWCWWLRRVGERRRKKHVERYLGARDCARRQQTEVKPGFVVFALVQTEAVRQQRCEIKSTREYVRIMALWEWRALDIYVVMRWVDGCVGRRC